MNTSRGFFIGRVLTEWSTIDPRIMKVKNHLSYTDPRGNKWDVPSGTVVDGASTGWFLRRLFPAFVGLYRRATVFHDYYCMEKMCPSWQVHRMFWEAMRCDDTHPVTAWLMWFGVRVFGPRFKGPNNET